MGQGFSLSVKSGRKRHRTSDAAGYSTPDRENNGKRQVHWAVIAGIIALITLVVYLPALRNDFVSLDDYGYITDNMNIRSLKPEFFAWAFTNLSAGFWHPLTWISYAIDYSVWGLNPFGYHLTAILIHALNTFLVVRLILGLFDTARLMNKQSSFPDSQGALIAAGTTALLFGLHPLHVESVVWVSERKDLLCALFYLLSLISYLHYVGRSSQHPSGTSPGGIFLDTSFAASLAFFVLALASKTMAVSIPVVMLILDLYPLRRLQSLKKSLTPLLEKIPFIAASLIIAIASIVAQKSIGALALTDLKPFSIRILVACKAVMIYLWKMVMPLHLIPFYPYPDNVSILSLEFGLPLLLCIGLTACALLTVRKTPVWLASWGTYLIILLPTLGFVQVGVHSMADRFTYLPSLAPFLLTGIAVLKMGVPTGDGTPASQWHGLRLLALFVAVTCALSFATVKQIAVWKNSLILWNYVIENGATYNPMAFNSRGHVFKDMGNFDAAIADYTVASEQEPARVEYLVSRAVAYAEKGQLEQSLADLNRAIELNPSEYMAFNNRANVWYRKGDSDRAMADLNRAISFKPSEQLAYFNRATLRAIKGDSEQAIEDYSRVLALNPLRADVYIERGDLYMKRGAMDLAARDYIRAGTLGDRSRMPRSGERHSP